MHSKKTRFLPRILMASATFERYFLVIVSGKNKWSTHLSLGQKSINMWKKNDERGNRRIKGRN
jgi:hypothetical protein